MTHVTYQFGLHAERLAAGYLEARGFCVLALRYRTRTGEVDIVAREARTVVFVEVKARRSADCGAAEEAITPLKRHRLVAVAQDFLARHRLVGEPCRFDVVTVDAAQSPPRVRHYPGAFDAG